MQPPDTPATTALQGMVKQGSDPSIPYAFAQRRQDVANSFQNPLGAYTTPAVRDAANRVTGEKLAMDESTAMQASKLAGDEAAFGRQATVAGLTSPRLVQTGGTSSGTSTADPGWGQYARSGVGTVAQIGMSLL